METMHIRAAGFGAAVDVYALLPEKLRGIECSTTS
jgi:hypothetical protein